MARPPSPTLRRRQLATTLRRLRLKAGKTLDEAAEALESSSATLSRIENEVRIPGARDVRDLCAFYGVTDPQEVADIVALVAGARESGWWEAYSEVDEQYATFIGLEVAATAIHQFEGLVIPGLLQTADYARHYLAEAIGPGRLKPFSKTDIDKRVEVRLERQAILAPSSGLIFDVIIDEATLRRPVGGQRVMAQQIGHILRVSESKNVHVRLLPFTAGAYVGQQGGFIILTLPHDVSDVVYLDTLAGEYFIETLTEIARHRRVFDLIGKSSLDEEGTREALLRMMSKEGGSKDEIPA